MVISLDVRHGHAVTSVIVDRGVSQRASESPSVFVMVTDEIWSELRQKWAASGHGLRCDHVDLICLGYAEYISPLFTQQGVAGSHD